MDISLLELRPLLIGGIEYFLALCVLRKGIFLKNVIALFLFFLGSYQIGEFLFFISGLDKDWLKISLFSTTMLPPLGMMIIEALSGRRMLSKFFLIVSIVFGMVFVLDPYVIPESKECNCFLKFDGNSLIGRDATFFNAWVRYYVLSLMYSMFMIALYIKKGYGDTYSLKLLFLGYASFFPASYFIAHYIGRDLSMVASIMCALAIITAFITTRISLNGDLLENKDVECDALIPSEK